MQVNYKSDILLGTNFGTQVADYEKGRVTSGDELLNYVSQKIKELNPTSLLEQIPVVDLGCGTGKSTEALYKMGLQNICGLDPDLKMLAAAREKADKTNSVPNINYFEGTVSDIQTIFQNQKFRVVTAFTAFHWFCSIEEVNAIKTIMATNSIFIVATKSDRTSYSPAQLKFFKMLGEIRGSPLPNPFKNFYPAKVLQECGFEVDVQYFPKKTLYNIETLKARARSFGGWCNLTEEQKSIAELKLDEMVQMLFKEESDKDGLYHETSEEMCVMGYLKS